MRDDLAIKNMHRAVLALHIQCELRAEVLQLHIRRMHEEALRCWRHMHANATAHTTRFPGREDFDLRGTLDQNRRPAEELNLRQAFVQGQLPR